MKSNHDARIKRDTIPLQPQGVSLKRKVVHIGGMNNQEPAAG